MNYQRIHDRLIERARSRQIPSGVYCERHHVVPRSMGGSDEPANLVILTAREHYMVHWLLFKIHRNQAMAFAWFRMTGGRSDVERYTSHTFKYASAARRLAASEALKGRALSPEHRAALSKGKLGKTYADMGRGESPLKGRECGDVHRQRIGVASKGRTPSAETREKLRQSKLGSANPQFGKVISPEQRAKISASVRAFHKAKARELEKMRSSGASVA